MRFSPLQLLRCVDGNVFITFGLIFPVLLSAAGLAVDSASFYDQQARMQNVADAASLAVAKELNVYRKNLDQLKTLGQSRTEALLTQSGIANRPHTVDVGLNPADNLVEITVAMVASSFMPVQVWGENPIRVISRARAYGQAKLCVLALQPASKDALKADGKASLTAPQCATQSNSSDQSGLAVASDSHLTSTVICSSGGVNGAASSFDPTPTLDCPKLDDPLAERQAPKVGGCTYNNLDITGKTSISPGVYCGGLKIEKTAVVTAEPGVYIFTLGKLQVVDTASLTGEDLTFYFADDQSALFFDTDTTIDLSASKAGDMAGILFMENHLAPLGRDFSIKSINAHRLLGTIYLPRGKLTIDSPSKVAELSAYTVIVAQQVKVHGANLVVNADYANTNVPVPEGVGPHSSMVRLDR